MTNSIIFKELDNNYNPCIELVIKTNMISCSSLIESLVKIITLHLNFLVQILLLIVIFELNITINFTSSICIEYNYKKNISSTE